MTVRSKKGVGPANSRKPRSSSARVMLMLLSHLMPLSRLVAALVM